MNLFNQNFFYFFIYSLVVNLFFVDSIAAANYYVNDNITTGDVFTSSVGNNSNNGTSPATPKATLTNVWTTYGPAGTNVLTSGDIIYVDAGTYVQTDRDLNITVAGIIITGAGTELTIFDNESAGATGYTFMRFSANDIELNDFKIYRYGRDNTYAHALHIHSGYTGITINNIHIDDTGRSTGEYTIEIESGASVTLNGGGTTCNNNWILSGGIRIVGATSQLVVNDYTFFNNIRSEKGICLRQENGTVTINNSIFENNENGSSTTHGIVFLAAGNLTIRDCIFNNNRMVDLGSSTRGGVIALEGGTFHMTRSRITNTQKSGGSGSLRGAAIGTNGAVTATIDSCYFEGNQGDNTRATDVYVRNASASVTAIDCTFGSSADQIGCESGTLTISFSGNPTVGTSLGTITTTNTTAPRYTANPTIDLYSGDCMAGVVLPIELSSFNGSCVDKGIEIIWVTESELNNHYFTIERANSSLIFEEIGQVFGAGNSVNQITYTYLDPSPSLGVNYYRLKQTDFDGVSEVYSPISIINNCKDLNNRAFFKDDKLIITVDNRINEISTLYVYDLQGKLVYSNNSLKEYESILGMYEVPLINNIASGIYLVVIQDLSFNNNNTFKVIKN